MSNEGSLRGLVVPGFFCGAAFTAVYFIFQIGDGPSECGSAATAYVISQEAVAVELKSPSSAKFPKIGVDGVSSQKTGDCMFTVQSFVDAENGFGAVIRTKYKALLAVDQETGRWATLGLDLVD